MDLKIGRAYKDHLDTAFLGTAFAGNRGADAELPDCVVAGTAQNGNAGCQGLGPHLVHFGVLLDFLAVRQVGKETTQIVRTK